MALNIQSSDPHTGETRTLTCTMRPLLETSCPPNFMDIVSDQEPPTDTVSQTLDPSAAPLTDEALIQELLDWTDGVEDPLMKLLVEVCLHICLHISHLNPVPCRWRNLSLEMRRGESRLQRFHLRTLRKWSMRLLLFLQLENLTIRLVLFSKHLQEPKK